MQARDVKVGERFQVSGHSTWLTRINATGYKLSWLHMVSTEADVIAVDESFRLTTVHPNNSALLDVTSARRRANDVIDKMHDADLTDLLHAAGIVPHESIEGRADQLMIALTGSSG